MVCVWDVLLWECFPVLLGHPAAVSCSGVTTPLLSQATRPVLLSLCQVCVAAGAATNSWLSGCCFILCKSTKLLATCNTQLGLRHPGSLQDSAQLVLGHKVPCWNGHPLPFSPYEVQQSRIREFVASWAGTALLPECMVWLTGCRDVCGACLHLIIVLPFPFFLPFPFSQSYLLHGHSV